MSAAKSLHFGFGFKSLLFIYLSSKTWKNQFKSTPFFVYLSVYINLSTGGGDFKKNIKSPSISAWMTLMTLPQVLHPRPPGPGARSVGRNPSPSHPRGCCHLCTHGVLKARNILKPHCPWQSTLWLCQNSYWKWWLSLIIHSYLSLPEGIMSPNFQPKFGGSFPAVDQTSPWHPHPRNPKDQTQVRPHQQALILRHVTGKIWKKTTAGWVNFYDYPRSYFIYFHPKHVSSSMHFNFNHVFTSSYWKKTLALQDVSGWAQKMPWQWHAMAISFHRPWPPGIFAKVRSPRDFHFTGHTCSTDQHPGATCAREPRGKPPEGGGFTWFHTLNCK